MARILTVFVPTSTLVFFFVEMVMLAACYAAAGYVFYSFEDMADFYATGFGGFRLLALVLTVQFFLYFNHFYSEIRVSIRLRLVQQICLVLGLAFICQAFLDYINPRWILPKWMMIGGSVLALIALSVWRVYLSKAGTSPLVFQRFLFLGLTPIASQIAAFLKLHPELGLVTVGYLSEGEAPEGSPFSPDFLPHLGGIEKLDDAIAELQPNCLTVNLRESHLISTSKLLDLRFSGMRVEDVQYLYELAFGRICLSAPPREIVFSTAPARPVRKGVGLSAVIAAFLLVLASPVILAIVVALKLSNHPLLQHSRRVGLQQQPFDLLDFSILDSGGKPSRIGDAIRKFGLIKLPRLWNVVRGDMSFVGPLPENPDFAHVMQNLIPLYSERTVILPGLTSWASVNTRSFPNSRTPYSETVDSGQIRNAIEALECDLYYVKYAGWSLDTYILLQTIKNAIAG